MKFVKINTQIPSEFEKYIENTHGSSKQNFEFLRHVYLQPPQGSFVYGFLVGEKIIASVSYIGHSVCRDGNVGIAFQACNVFTNSEYRGQGLFSKIAKKAEEDLLNHGAIAIIGFPNEKAAPIWTRKLGYTICDTRPVLLPPLSFIKLFDESVLSGELASNTKVTFDAREMSDWKKSIHKDIFEDEFLTNYMFGRIMTRNRMGLKWRVLVIAGLEINKPYVFEKSIRRLMKRHNCSFCRISVNESSALVRSAKFARSGKLTEPFIAKGLNWDVSAADFEATGGVKDVF